jgi:hypothetical protein
MPTPQLGYFFPVGGGHPDQGLPGGGGPVDPGYGVDAPDQIWPPDSLPPLPPGVWPSPPVGVWPPTRPTRPSHPIVIYPGRPSHGLPGAPGHPDQGLPGSPGHPDQGLPPVGFPDQGLPPGVDNTLPPPATVWPPLPPGTGIAGMALILVWVVGVGYRWLLVKGHDIWPPQPEPPVAQPK